jgi:hypothetical protein
MNKLGKWIFILFGAGLILSGIVRFVIIPKQEAAAEQYENEQKHPLTHDLDYIIGYKNDYMGNASNTTQLFYHLPLGDTAKEVELNPDELEVIVHYGNSVKNIGTAKVQQSLVYDSTAAFALIANLEKITYHFRDETFSIERKAFEKLYGGLETFIENKDIWNQKVRDPLADKRVVKERFSLFE